MARVQIIRDDLWDLYFSNKFARFVCCTEFLFVLVFVFLFKVLRILLFCLVFFP